MNIETLFHQFLQASGCIPSGSKVLVAVSGGADSVALLHLLRGDAENLGIVLTAAHLDHCLRDDSCEDSHFVEELCRRLNIPVVVERQDVAKIAAMRKGNLEEVGREVRREFLERTAVERGCDLIALGHHADDQAETFLMRLLRGAGSKGLSGMSLVSGKIVRPLLNFQRQQLIKYLQELGLEWREDLSNQDLRFTRNRIRHELLPLLQSFNPNINSHIADLCGRLYQDETFWDALVAEEMQRCSKCLKGDMSLDRKVLENMPLALSARVVRQALKDVRGDLRGIASIHIEDVLTLINEGPVQGELDLPGAWVGRRYDELLIQKARPVSPMFSQIPLEGEGRFLLPDGHTLVLSLEKSASNEQLEAVEFAADNLGFPLTLRHCLPGDRIRPSGMQGSKKLQDLFVDLKVPREERRNYLVLLHENEVLWVVGLRRCEGYRPEPGKEVLRVAIEPHFQS